VLEGLLGGDGAIRGGVTRKPALALLFRMREERPAAEVCSTDFLCGASAELASAKLFRSESPQQGLRGFHAGRACHVMLKVVVVMWQAVSCAML
jgi:hypothetical protein